MPFESGPQFLKEKYDLQTKPEVAAAVKRTEMRTGEEVSDDPDDQIENYLARFVEIINREDPARQEHGMEALKRFLHSRFVIKPEAIPDSYWEAQIQQSREMGSGELEVDNELREKETQRVIKDQEESLDRWIDYLALPDAHYPNYLKYYTVRSVLGMGNYDPNRHTFTERTPHTVKRFPTLSQGALARTLDGIERYFGAEYFRAKEELLEAQNKVKQAKNALSYAKKQHPDEVTAEQADLAGAQAAVQGINQQLEDLINGQIDENPDQPRFPRALMSADFASLYAIALEKSGTAKKELWPVTEGVWKTYAQGQEQELVSALDGQGTDWCLEGTATTENYLGQGELLVYYSEDERGEAKIPRAGVFVVDGKVMEVHGVDTQQNLDPYMATVVRDKMHELGDQKYEKRALDMRLLTYLERKAKAGHPLDKDDLIFLYEIDGSIEGFGYQKDPRIAELRSQRDPKEDAPIVFECLPEEIAYSVAEISNHTKAYIGEWNQDTLKVIRQFPSLHTRNLYESFPDKRIFCQSLEVSEESCVRTAQEAKAKLRADIKINPNAESMIERATFTGEIGQREFASFTVSQLFGDRQSHTMPEILEKTKNDPLLSLCLPEDAIYLRNEYQDQPLGDWKSLAMKPITSRDGYPSVFDRVHGDDGLWLRSAWADPSREWDAVDQFVFRLRKLSPES